MVELAHAQATKAAGFEHFADARDGLGFALHRQLEVRDQKTRHTLAIAANIPPPITPAQAEEAIKLLLDIGLIKTTASGYAVAENHIYTEKDVQAMAARQHIQELMAMAAQVFPDLPAAQRQYNALMFSISKDGFQAIKDRIRSFQEELREIIDRDRNEDRVYTLTLQLFPNTKVPS